MKVRRIIAIVAVRPIRAVTEDDEKLVGLSVSRRDDRIGVCQGKRLAISSEIASNRLAQGCADVIDIVISDAGKYENWGGRTWIE